MSTWIPPEQLMEIKSIDLLTYLERHEPDELVRLGAGVYSTRTHDSVRISNGKWCRWSPHNAAGDGKMPGGKSALDYLVKVRGMDFLTAAGYLRDVCGTGTVPAQSRPEQPRKEKPFLLPEPHTNCGRVRQYLTGRGISAMLIDGCVQAGRLYEENQHHNCVFVGFDTDNAPRYAFLRGTYPGSSFMREAEGSVKRFSFSLPNRNGAETLRVFESAIDLLSYMTLALQNGKDIKNSHYLSLGGVYAAMGNTKGAAPPSALEQFLKDHKDARRIVTCLDNDRAGRACAELIRALYGRAYTVESRFPKEKDFNLDLQRRAGIARELSSGHEEHSR